MSKLVFTSDGQHLLHWFQEQKRSWSSGAFLVPRPTGTKVVVWDIASSAPCATVPGYLIGVANDALTFLTLVEGGSVKAWRVSDGVTVPLEDVEPTGYSLDQRVFLEHEGDCLFIVDAFDRLPRVRVPLTDPTTQVVLGPRLWVASWYDLGGGIDGADGNAFDLATGEKAWHFKVNRHAVTAPAYWSSSQNLVLLGTSLEAHTIDSGKLVGEPLFKIQVRAVREAVGLPFFHGVGVSDDGETLAVSTDENRVQLWREGECLAKLKTSPSR